jgi:hypothetical protein
VTIQKNKKKKKNTLITSSMMQQDEQLAMLQEIYIDMKARLADASVSYFNANVEQLCIRFDKTLIDEVSQ